MRKPRVLIVDDEEGMREVCQESLEDLEVEVVTEAESPRAVERLKDESFDLLITDIRMPGVDGVTLLRTARQHDPALPVLMITGFPTMETAIECLKLGAVDYVTKPFVPDDLVANVKRLLDERQLREENVLLRRQVSRDYGFDDLIGSSPPMAEVLDIIRRIAEAQVDVLITGETGTGKELVARAIHRRSRRGKEKFVPVDCGAIPEHLLESEFFGYGRARSPAPTREASACSSTRTVGPSSWTRSASFRPSSRPSCCARSRSGASVASGARPRRRSTCAWLRPRAATSTPWSRRAPLGTTSSTASTW